MTSETAIRITKLIERDNEAMLSLTGFDRPIRIPLLLMHELRLVQGIVLTQSQIERLRVESDKFTTEQTALRILALRDHSIGELRAKLARRDLPADAIAQTVKALKERGYLDDQKYAIAYAAKIVRERPCGYAWLVGHLMKKMLSRKIAEETASMTLQASSETTLAIESLKRRWRHLSQFELEVAQRKAYTYLSGRGFSYAAAKAAFEHLNRKKDEDSD